MPQAAELRASLREHDANFRVVKNTLTLLAADKAGVGEIKELVAEGPTALTFVRGRRGAGGQGARHLLAARPNVLEFKGGLMEGRVLDADEIRQLARLPSRDVLVAQFAGVVASPLTGLVRGLGSMLGGLAMALEQVRDRRRRPGSAAEAPARGGPCGRGGPSAEEARRPRAGGESRRARTEQTRFRTDSDAEKEAQ